MANTAAEMDAKIEAYNKQIRADIEKKYGPGGSQKRKKTPKAKDEGKKIPRTLDQIYNQLTQAQEKLFEHTDEMDLLLMGGLTTAIVTKLTYMDSRGWQKVAEDDAKALKALEIYAKFAGWSAEKLEEQKKDAKKFFRARLFRTQVGEVAQNTGVAIALVAGLKATRGSDIVQGIIWAIIAGIIVWPTDMDDPLYVASWMDEIEKDPKKLVYYGYGMHVVRKEGEKAGWW